MDPETQIIKHLCQTHVASFTRLAFGMAYPDREYRHHWPIEVIGDYLTRCHEGKIKRLIINMPPRYLKSFCVSVAFPAWVLAHNPYAKIMCVAGHRGLAEDQHALTRQLMSHPNYRSLFPHVRWSESSQTIRVAHGGVRSAHVVSSGGVTGRGADMIIIDDPLGAGHTEDDNHRELVNRWYDRNIYQRLDDKAKGVVIVVMQRLHVDDLTGHLLKQDGWEHLNLPAIAVEEETYMLSNGRKVGRRKGEALHPGLESRDQLRKVVTGMGAIPFMSQYQQDPYPPGEGLGYHGAITIPPQDPSTPLSHGRMFFGHISQDRVVSEKLFGEPLGLIRGCPPPLTNEEWEARYAGPREIAEWHILPWDGNPPTN